MSRNIISLDPEDKQWLEQKAKATNRPVTALVRQAIQQMHQEDELKSPSLDLLLEPIKLHPVRPDQVALTQLAATMVVPKPVA